MSYFLYLMLDSSKKIVYRSIDIRIILFFLIPKNVKLILLLSIITENLSTIVDLVTQKCRISIMIVSIIVKMLLKIIGGITILALKIFIWGILRMGLGMDMASVFSIKFIIKDFSLIIKEKEKGCLFWPMEISIKVHSKIMFLVVRVYTLGLVVKSMMDFSEKV